jgi:hypothetical protein
MPSTDSNSFLNSYAQEASDIEPTEAQVARAYRNIELAENAEAAQAEQQRLLAPRGPSPEMQAQLAAARAYAQSIETPISELDISLIEPSRAAEPEPRPKLLGSQSDWKTAEFETYGEEGALLSKAPAITPQMAPAPEIVAQPFAELDETGMKAIAREARPLGAVKNYNAMPFKSAFRAALDDGLDTFAWKGKQYTTQTKEKIKVQEEKAAARPPALQVGEERITDIADLPRYEDPGFTDALEEQGFSIKEGVTAEGVRPEMSHAVKTVAPIFKKLGIDSSGMVLTSGMRDEGGWSFHETGDAIDIRFRPEQVFPGVTGDELRTKIRGVEQRVVEALGAGWDVDLSSHGTGWHLHIEQETEMARQRLHEHGKKHGIKPGEIRNAASKAKYESFLKGK